MSLDLLAYLSRPPAGEPAGALVLVHGRGADEHDLVPLFDLLDPLRQLACVSPRGPLSLPPGGAHWYVVERVGYPDRETFDATFARAAAWLDALPELTGVPLERTVIGGFSQGCVMAYALGLGQGRPTPAGIVALSGFLPAVEGFELQLDRPGLRVAIGHGSLDPVIEPGWGHAARDLLESAGATVTFRESPIGHAIDPAFLRELQGWVTDTLAASANRP